MIVAGCVNVHGDIYIVCDSNASALSLCSRLNTRYKEEVDAKQCVTDTEWVKCNAHKHLCLSLNFTVDSRSSCVAGWVKHSARSAKSRKRNAMKGTREGVDMEEEESEFDSPATSPVKKQHPRLTNSQSSVSCESPTKRFKHVASDDRTEAGDSPSLHDSQHTRNEIPAVRNIIADKAQVRNTYLLH